MSKSSRARFILKNEYFNYLKETATEVDPYVKNFISINFSESDLKLNLMSRYRFGKSQLRPAQVRLAYELFGGKNWKKIVPVCASLEIKDTAYYCLDDFFDKKKEFPLPILAGLFSSISYSMLSDLDDSFKSESVVKILSEMTNLDFKNVEAFLADKNLTVLNEDLYFKKIEGYNFWETPLRIGAILANATEKDIDIIGNVGKYIGVGYIVANDTWDFGKNLEDFSNGKYTVSINHLLQNVAGDKKEKLEELFGEPNLSDAEKDYIRKIAVVTGTIDYGKQLAQIYCDEGLLLLDSFLDSKPKKLLQFSTSMTQRNKFYDSLRKFEE